MFIYQSEQLKDDDLLNIQRCGKVSLPIYYQLEHLNLFLMKKNSKIWVLKDNDNFYGFIIFEFINPKKIHILSLAIHPKFRNRNLASHILDNLKNKFIPEIITLYVQISNIPAVNFYFKNNFKIEHFIKDYYTNLTIKGAYKMKLLNIQSCY